MNKKKVLIIILIVILIIILILVMFFLKKFLIIKKLQNNIEQYSELTNYYTKITQTYENSENIQIMEYYVKGEKQVAIFQNTIEGEVSTTYFYNTGERIDVYYDNSEGKTAELGADTEMTITIYNYLETDSVLETLLSSLTATITIGDYNGIECYIISNFNSYTATGEYKNEIYIEKDTGLCLKAIIDDVTYEREYKFDNVSDDVFAEPDLGQYTIL